MNGAGVAPSAPLVKTTDEHWRQAIETNLSGAFYCLREALPAMTARGWGRVVNVASIAGKTGYPVHRGLRGQQTRRARPHQGARPSRWRRAGVTVNAVCPGYVDTPMTDASVRRIVEKTGVAAADVRRRLEDIEPAEAALDRGRGVGARAVPLRRRGARHHGQALSVDGGTVV